MYWDTGMIFWIVIGVIIVTSIVFRYLASVSRDRTIRDLAERGQTITPEMFVTPRRGGTLVGGLFMLFIGVATVLFFWVLSGQMPGVTGEMGVPQWLPILGVFPIAIGLALIIGWLVNRRPIDRQ